MIKKVGLCENFGACELADNKTPIDIIKGEAVCPKCGSELEEEKSIPWKTIIALAAFLVLLLTGILFIIANRNEPLPANANKARVVLPTPTPTLNPLNECVTLPQHKNVWEDIHRRGHIIMGVQSDADPMNSTGKNKDDEKGYEQSEIQWEKAKEGGSEGEKDRRRKELNWARTGFDYDLMKLLAKEMGLMTPKNLKAREVKEFRELFCLLNRQEENGEFSVDLIMSGIAKDDTYSDTISWSDSYLDLYYSLVTKKNSPIKDLADCKGKKIGIVKSDNVVKKFVANQAPEAIIVSLDDGPDDWMSNALNTNSVEAVIQDYPFAVSETQYANEELAKNPSQELEIRKNNLKSDDPQYNPQYVIGVPKGETELLVRINEAIAKVKDSPEYIKLVQEYLRSEFVSKPKIVGEVYPIKKGDSLSKIALKELGDANRWPEIKELNNLAIEHLIFEHDKLIMPSDWKKKNELPVNKPQKSIEKIR